MGITQNGKLKIFGSYGVVNDVMKLLLAQTSWGAQAYEQCTYPLGPDASGRIQQFRYHFSVRNERPRLPDWRAHCAGQLRERRNSAVRH